MFESGPLYLKHILRLVACCLFTLLTVGCGGGGGGGGGTGSAPPQGSAQVPGSPVVVPTEPARATIRIESVLARTIPSSVTHLRLTGFDLSGVVRYGPEAKAKAEAIEFTNVPVSVRRILVEYLEQGRVVGQVTSDIILEPGEVRVMSDLPFSDVETSLTSISIEPRQLTLIEGTSEQLRVVGRYNDGTVLDLSNSASWGHTGTAIQVDGTGQVRAVEAGSSEIQASVGSLTASSSVTVVAAKLTTLRFEPAVADVPAGMSIPLLVRGLYNNGTQRDLTQQVEIVVENSLVAETAPAAGQVTGKEPGSTKVRAFFGELSAEADLTVTQAVLTRLDVSPAVGKIPVGSQQAFLAVGLFSDGSTMDLTRSVRWASDDTDKVSIDENGMTLARVLGETTIRASLDRFSGSSSIEVTSAVPTKLVVEPFRKSIPVGASESLRTVVLYSDGSSREVTSETFFQSAAPEVVEVSNFENRGLARANSIGTTQINASFGELTGHAEIQVTEAVAQWLRIEPFGATFAKGTTHAFLVRALFSDGTSRDVTADTTLLLPVGGVAFLTGVPGEVKAREVGNGELSAQYLGLTAQATLIVTPAELVRIDVTPQDLELPKGVHQAFQAVGSYTDETTQDLTGSVSWSTSMPEVLSVNLDGEGIAVAEGTAEVSASLEGRRGTAQVLVGPATIDRLTLTPSAVEFPKGLSRTLTATVHFSDATTLEVNDQTSFSSSAPEIVSVSNLSTPGLITGEDQGSAVITASYEGEEATSSVTVLPAALQSVRLEPGSLEIPIGIEKQVKLWGLYSDQIEREISTSFTLKVDDDEIAGIQGSNVVKGRSLGETVLTGTFGGFSSQAQVAVSEAVPVSLKIVPAETPLEVGTSRKFHAVALLSDGKLLGISENLEWSSLDPTIFSVTSSGEVQAIKAGSSTLLATLDELKAELDLDVLTELDSPWTTTGGNFARTGENLTEDAGPPNSLLWQRSFAPNPTNTVRSHPVVSANGIVYAAFYVYNREYHLYALDARDGDVLWSHTFEHGISNIGEPTYADGKIYIGQCDHSTNSFMWCFNAITGTPIWSSPMSVQWPRFWAPLVVEGGVFSQSGYYGGMQGWDAVTGRQRFVIGLEQTDQWSPSYYRGKVYSKARNTLRAHEPIGGHILESYSLPYNSSGGSYSFPAMADGAAFVIDDGSIRRIKLEGESGPASWNSTGYFFRGVAAVSEGVVYGVSGGSLLALDAEDGGWLWSFSGDNQLSSSPVIAGDYIYISSGANTYAVNRRTRQMEWSVAFGGKLSVADGRLFIMANNAVLRVYELQQ